MWISGKRVDGLNLSFKRHLAIRLPSHSRGNSGTSKALESGHCTGPLGDGSCSTAESVGCRGSRFEQLLYLSRINCTPPTRPRFK